MLPLALFALKVILYRRKGIEAIQLIKIIFLALGIVIALVLVVKFVTGGFGFFNCIASKIERAIECVQGKVFTKIECFGEIVWGVVTGGLWC